ncbi:hypothetical protein F5887DRAFT_971730 [Amanita rubescens]|nr:hypothetical protein F5887DRAFT_971730 [Amanita rubescens]
MKRSKTSFAILPSLLLRICPSSSFLPILHFTSLFVRPRERVNDIFPGPAFINVNYVFPSIAPAVLESRTARNVVVAGVSRE